MSKFCRLSVLAVAVVFAAARPSPAADGERTIRVATYNTSLYRDEAGQLIRDLETGTNDPARKIAEIIQRVRPDVVLLNEFDYDAAGRAAELFREKYLRVSQSNCEPIEFAHSFAAPVNTGEPSGRDLDNNGLVGGPDDAIGYGRHSGQYDILVLSTYPIDREHIRTFQKFLWRDMPNALLPADPQTGAAYYDDGDLAVLRLSSKSHWDIPIHAEVREGGNAGERTVAFHLICSHPTPPVFDGPEDRNGRRNHDEIRLIADLIDHKKSSYLVDDAGRRGGLPAPVKAPAETEGPGSRYETAFVIVGDLNCDPVDGAGMPGTMDRLLKNPLVNSSFTPTSKGGPLTVKRFPDQFATSRGDPAHVTANFTAEGHGYLRIDYVLPSRGFEIVSGGIFWPAPGEDGAEALSASDHHLVWLDIRPK